ncbi:MAG: DMT family transporter [Bdellovibrionota bacterium]|nr:DMT family transporter [Bdellovibrionota bacterium]
MLNLVFVLSLAFIAGLSLGVNRSILGKLGSESNPIQASVLNHLSGTIFLAVFIAVFFDFQFINEFNKVPFLSFWGGAIGAVFIVITSFVIPRIGVLKTSIFFIGGQIVCGSLIDILMEKISNIPQAALGIAFILLGLCLKLIVEKLSSRKEA